MKNILFTILGLLLISCSNDNLIGQWMGSAKYDYFDQWDTKTKCLNFEFDLLKTESNNYYGNGTLKWIHCDTKKMDYASDFTITRVIIDKPMIYMNLSIDGSGNDSYQFQGILENNQIKGKMFTRSTNSSQYDISFKMNFEKQN